jgi:hypothetical protein
MKFIFIIIGLFILGLSKLVIFSSAADGHPHDDDPIHRKMHSKTDHLDNPLQIEGLIYSKCHKLGVCTLVYSTGNANKQAQTWGFYLPTLSIQMEELKAESLIALNRRCYYHTSWQSSLFTKVKSILKEAEKIHLSGRKFRQIVIGHLHVDEVPLTTKMIEAADKIDCKRN